MTDPAGFLAAFADLAGLLQLPDGTARRGVGEVRLGACASTGIAAVAVASGLEVGALVEVLSAGEAAARIEAVLGRDLAYGLPALDADLAESVALRFVELAVAAAGPGGRPFLSNGLDPLRVGRSCSYRSATDATFDGGVVAVTAVGCAWIWVEDED